MKLKNLVIICISFLFSSLQATFANPLQNVSIDATFVNINDNSLRVLKSVRLNPAEAASTTLMSSTKMINNEQVTLALILKNNPTRNGLVDLQFNLVQYGANKSYTLITQPRIVLKQEAGQTGELTSDNYKIKVTLS